MFARRPLSEATLRAMESVARGIAVGIEQRWAEERLHEQREWLRVTLASIGDAVIATDTDGRVAFLNHVAESLTGWTGAEASGRPLGEVFRIINEASRLPVESPVEKVLAEGQVVGLANHTLLIARDDAERPIDDSAAPIRDERGAIVGVVLIFRDVTERRRAERRVRQGEARKAAILETALDAIITIDHEGKLVEINPAAETIFGHARGDVLGREMCELFVPPSLREAHRRGMARYLATGEGPVLGRRFEITALRADGTEFPVELAITPISADGPPMFTAHVRDITERKRFERRREARLAVTEILAGASSIDEAIPKILRAVGEGLGWDVGELWAVAPEGDRLHCLGVWRSPDHPADEFEAVTRRTAFPRGIGLPGRVWSGGRPCWVPDVTADSNFPRAPIAAREGLHGAFGGPISLGGEVLGAVAFYSGEVRQPDDDTLEMMATLGGQIGQFFERKRAEEALVEADRHKDEFLATLAHELRNPLAPIRNSLHILKSPEADRALAEPVWEMMERQVHNMTRLVDDLMDVSRIHWGKIELRREEVDLASVVRRAVEASMPLIKERRHDLRVDLPDDAGPPGGRPDPAGADPRQPAEQRGEVHRPRRPDPAGGGPRGGPRRDPGPGHGHRHRAGDAVEGLRPVRPGRTAPGPVEGGPGDRPEPGPAARRDARRDDPGPQRGAGPGQRVRRAAPRPVEGGGASPRIAPRRRHRRRARAPPGGASWWWTTTSTRPGRWPCCWCASGSRRCRSPTTGRRPSRPPSRSAPR